MNHLQKRWHIRRKKNDAVFRNIHQLYDIAQQAHSWQEMVNQLSLWKDDRRLVFDNQFSYGLMIVAVFCLILFFIISSGQLLLILAAIVFGGLAFILYEEQTPVKNTIYFMEKQCIAKKYHFNYSYLPMPFASYHASPLLGLSFLKQQFFPLFDQGDSLNHFPLYANTIWTDHTGKQYPVLVFQYQYSKLNRFNEINQRMIRFNYPIIGYLMDLLQQDQQRSTEKIYNLYGVFVFDVDLHGFAASTEQLFTPYYPAQWLTSDIQLNHQIQIRGQTTLSLAKKITPSVVLALNQLFSKRSGHLYCHEEMPILCFLGDEPLFHANSAVQQLDTITQLRRHLSRFRLTYYERLQRDMLHLIAGNSSNYRVK